MNYYEILEVSPKASPEVIKAAYKSLMQRYHPDRNPGNAGVAEHALQVSLAYEVLSDADKRAAYDIEQKQQAVDHLSIIRGMSRDISPPPVLVVQDNKSGWFFWLFVTSILLSGWIILSLSQKEQPPEPGLKETTKPAQGERAEELPARTTPLFITPLTVDLKAADQSAESLVRVLSIPVLIAQVGAFDAERFIGVIEDNKEYISQKLAERLSEAKYEELVKAGGEQYLKEIILDSIGDTTGTDRFQDYPSTGSENPGRYGVVDVSFPVSFSVQAKKN